MRRVRFSYEALGGRRPWWPNGFQIRRTAFDSLAPRSFWGGPQRLGAAIRSVAEHRHFCSVSARVASRRGFQDSTMDAHLVDIEAGSVRSLWLDAAFTS